MLADGAAITLIGRIARLAVVASPGQSRHDSTSAANASRVRWAREPGQQGHHVLAAKAAGAPRGPHMSRNAQSGRYHETHRHGRDTGNRRIGAPFMYLSRVRVCGFRGAVDEPLEIRLPGRFAVIAGANGGGNTTLTDAIYLSHGKRFPHLPRHSAAALGTGDRDIEVEYRFDDDAASEGPLGRELQAQSGRNAAGTWPPSGREQCIATWARSPRSPWARSAMWSHGPDWCICRPGGTRSTSLRAARLVSSSSCSERSSRTEAMGATCRVCVDGPLACSRRSPRTTYWLALRRGSASSSARCRRVCLATGPTSAARSSTTVIWPGCSN